MVHRVLSDKAYLSLGLLSPLLRLRYFEIKMILVLNILSILGSARFKSKLKDQNRIFSEMKILQSIQNDVVVNSNDVMRISPF